MVPPICPKTACCMCSQRGFPQVLVWHPQGMIREPGEPVTSVHIPANIMDPLTVCAAFMKKCGLFSFKAVWETLSGLLWSVRLWSPQTACWPQSFVLLCCVSSQLSHSLVSSFLYAPGLRFGRAFSHYIVKTDLILSGFQ